MSSKRPSIAPKLSFSVFPRICAVMSWVCIAAIVVVALWVSCFIVPALLMKDSFGCTVNGKPCGQTSFIIGHIGFWLGFIIFTGPLIWGLYSAHRCFKGLAKGRYFDPRTVRAFRNFGLGVLIHKALLYAGPALLNTGLTRTTVTPGLANAAPPIIERKANEFSIGLPFSADPLFSERFLTLILLAAIVIVAHVLARATQLAEENEQFV